MKVGALVNIVDSTLSIKKVSWDILEILKGKQVVCEDTFLVEYNTYPFYNGRERSICIVANRRFHNPENTALYIVFGEHRSSDGIFLDIWNAPKSFNAPTSECFSEEAYDKRRILPYNAQEAVACIIHETLQIFSDESYNSYIEKMKSN